MPDAVLLSVGEVAHRAGLSVAAVRYYEERGLLSSTRTAGNQRRYPRHVLRRLAFVTAAQRVGLTLDEVADALDTLPLDHAPAPADWARLAAPWQHRITARIRELEALRDTLDGCLGCGCLSLTRCALYNADDEAAMEGPGSRWLRNASAPRTPAPGRAEPWLSSRRSVSRKDPSTPSEEGRSSQCSDGDPS